MSLPQDRFHHIRSAVPWITAPASPPFSNIAIQSLWPIQLISDKAFSELHFFKGQLLLDELTFNKDISEEEKRRIGLKAESEFKAILGSSKARETVNGYVGLFDLYMELGKEHKKDSLVREIISKPKIFSSVFMYNYRLKRDTVMSVYLLKKWLEVNPYDKKAKLLLDTLIADF